MTQSGGAERIDDQQYNKGTDDHKKAKKDNRQMIMIKEQYEYNKMNFKQQKRAEIKRLRKRYLGSVY